MAQYTRPIQNLIDQFSKLPGIGARSAERIVFHILKQPADAAMKFSEAIAEIKTRIRNCSNCYNLTEHDPCEICTDARRDKGLVCIIEQPKDLLALEATGLYQGVYHVLLGRIAPLDDINAQDLTFPRLIERLESGEVRELILATNPNLDGDATSLYTQNLVRENYPHVKLTRLARGLASGTQIEYANRNVLADAISGRQAL